MWPYGRENFQIITNSPYKSLTIISKFLIFPHNGPHKSTGLYFENFINLNFEEFGYFCLLRKGQFHFAATPIRDRLVIIRH